MEMPAVPLPPAVNQRERLSLMTSSVVAVCGLYTSVSVSCMIQAAWLASSSVEYLIIVLILFVCCAQLHWHIVDGGVFRGPPTFKPTLIFVVVFLLFY